MKRYKVAILGAGASGVMCALSTNEKSVALFDAAARPAKKLLVTGNGRCNLTNAKIESHFYNTNLDNFFKRFDQKQTIKFFEKLGLETYADEEGRVYPLSNTAKSVVDVIENNLKCDMFLGQKIEKIDSESGFFRVFTEKNVIEAEKIVVATGGNCENILKTLGLKHKKFVPSLVALRSGDTRDLNGAKLSNVLVKAKNFFGEQKEEMGEVLFKDEGLSGIVIFNLSTLFSRHDKFEGEISIDLLPDMTKEKLVEKIEKRKALTNDTNKLFVGMFQNAVSNEIFKQAKTNINKPCQSLAKSEIEKIADCIKNLTFKVKGCYDNNQVFSGGVSLDDLTENLESKKVKNVFVTGEAVDVDGACGGYNLQWAWTSGYIVGSGL